jgi:murein DD-endopeptidase MepM/ murein hydrolase activator NlpD
MPFHPVIAMPPDAVVLDLSRPWPGPSPTWSVGRYDEVRVIYDQPLFAGGRCVHMGIDLGAPVGTSVHAFADGRVLFAGALPAPGDYGHSVVTEHIVDGLPLFALHGHLSAASLRHSPPGRIFAAGEVLGWLGAPEENGGWPPHLHFQLCRERPDSHDLPGAVTLAERAAARERYPDPRQVLGALY